MYANKFIYLDQVYLALCNFTVDRFSLPRTSFSTASKEQLTSFFILTQALSTKCILYEKQPHPLASYKILAKLTYATCS